MKSLSALKRPCGLSYRAQNVSNRFGTAQLKTSAASTPARTTSKSTPPPSGLSQDEFNQYIREGHTEADYVQKQANKKNRHQGLSRIQSLQSWDTERTADVAVVGCGPAGLALAAEVALLGLSVVLIGEDAPFVNNYGVWVDEFKSMGLESTLECIWSEAVCYFGEEQEVKIERPYGRVDLSKLHEALVEKCQKGGVGFHQGFVEDIDTDSNPHEASIQCKGGSVVKTRMVTLASGAASGKFLKYEAEVPSPGAQTAYGIEVEVEGYSERYPEDQMLFMDYRRHHTGLWPNTAQRIIRGQHPEGGDGLWSCDGEMPSFLYAMPLGQNRVFLEETCLVAKPPLPFSQLKRRLLRRMEAMGLTVKQVYDEEWSYIPVGGPLPVEEQSITAFGSAANLIHPASGYSISRSLREAPMMAQSLQRALQSDQPTSEMSQRVWAELWTQEKRAQASFHIFGMELLAQLELPQINEFFKTFFRLPSYYWRGFLSSTISSFDLLVFAGITFVLAPPGTKASLIAHLILDPSGSHMLQKYFLKYKTEIEALVEKTSLQE